VSHGHEPDTEFDPDRVVIRDKRRLDPDTGAVRPDTGEARPDLPTEAGSPEPQAIPAREDELLADLQRVTAEYANYRKRVDRDRMSMVEMATAGVLESLLPLLDGIELARQHGDLDGAFKGVGEGLEQVAERYGLERLGAPGEPFDPAVHHALVHAPEDPLATVAVVAEVLQPGWRLRSGRVLRPAGVAVSDPGAPASAVPGQAPAQGPSAQD
jgi:molecular chaperone GrpE